MILSISLCTVNMYVAINYKQSHHITLITFFVDFIFSSVLQNKMMIVKNSKISKRSFFSGRKLSRYYQQQLKYASPFVGAQFRNLIVLQEKIR